MTKSKDLLQSIQSADTINLASYSTVFCDSLQALEWAYQSGLPKSAIIKTSSPSMLWDQKPNVQNIEASWTIGRLKKFQSTIKSLSENIFNTALNIDNVERDLALVISQSVFNFQGMLYKAACLEEDDFFKHRLFIYVEGEVGPMGNIMNSPWDKLLVSNPLFSMVNYKLRNDEWKVLTTQGISNWQRFKIAGYETLIYRLAVKLMRKLPSRLFTRELLIPNESEKHIEIAASLVQYGVKITEINIESISKVEGIASNAGISLIYETVAPIMRKRVEEWVAPSAVEVTMSLFKSHLENQLKQFELLVDSWSKVIIKSDRVKQSVLVNAPGSIKNRALSYVCRKNNIPIMSSPHGITIEISRAHSNMLHVLLSSSIADMMFMNNYKAVDVAQNSYFNNAKHYVVGMPLRLIRMKYAQKTDKLAPPIVYVSTNLYHMGFSASEKTDYSSAKSEQKIITDVLSKLPHKVCYKTYPEDNRRYADVDPVLRDVKSTNNIVLFSDKVDMRYLVSKYSIFVTTCATSTLGWVVMSGKPVVFIDQKNNNPMTDDAHVSLSKGIFVFDDDMHNFHKNLRNFLSKPISEIDRLWSEKKKYREKMIKNYFSTYEGGAGKRAVKIILRECFS